MCGGYSGTFESRNDCYEYRSSSNSWTSMPSMTTKRYFFSMIYLKGTVYAVGGDGEWGSGSLNSMESFDPTTRTWTKQSIPFSARSHCITQLSANQLVLIGGYSGRYSSSNVMTKNISIHLLNFSLFHKTKYFLQIIFF